MPLVVIDCGVTLRKGVVHTIHSHQHLPRVPQVPDYGTLVAHPMDFATMEVKLREGLYTTFDSFVADVELVVANALLYNAPDTIFYLEAKRIGEAVRPSIDAARDKWEAELEEQRAQPMHHKANGSPLPRAPPPVVPAAAAVTPRAS